MGANSTLFLHIIIVPHGTMKGLTMKTKEQLKVAIHEILDGFRIQMADIEVFFQQFYN